MKYDINTVKNQLNRCKAKSVFFCMLAVSFVSAISMSSPVFGQNTEAGKAAAAEISEKKFDFGTVVEGTEVVHDFTIKNVGSAVLEIKKVKTD